MRRERGNPAERRCIRPLHPVVHRPAAADGLLAVERTRIPCRADTARQRLKPRMDVALPRDGLGDLAVGAEDRVGHGPACEALSQRQGVGIASQLVEVDDRPDLIAREMTARRLFQFHRFVHKLVALPLHAFQLSADEPLDGNSHRRIAGIFEPCQQPVQCAALGEGMIHRSALRVVHQAVGTEQLEQVALQLSLGCGKLRAAHAHSPGQDQPFQVAPRHIPEVPARVLRRCRDASLAPQQKPRAIVLRRIEPPDDCPGGQRHRLTQIERCRGAAIVMGLCGTGTCSTAPVAGATGKEQCEAQGEHQIAPRTARVSSFHRIGSQNGSVSINAKNR